MGYPVQQGAEFETVVFQNNLVRSYTLPKDPRSDSMMFHRRFLSDVSKMRGMLGVWGKTALLEALGRTWATVLFQLIKSDSFSWWSDAQEEWDSFDEVDQQAWRDAAPYQVTFNDMGWIFFGLSRVIYKALEKYHHGLWEAELWGVEDSAAALEWWETGKVGAQLTAVTIDSPHMKLIGTWEVFSSVYKKMSAVESASVQVVFIGKAIRFYYLVGPDLGIGYLKIGTDEPIEINAYNSGGYGGTFIDYEFPRKRFGSITYYPAAGEKIGIRYFGIDGTIA